MQQIRGNGLRTALRLPRPADDPRVLYDFRRVAGVPAAAQALLVVVAFVAAVLLTHREYRSHGTCFGFPGPAFHVLFSPLLEELVFRGWMLGRLARWHSNLAAIVISSALFGLLHLRLIYWLEPPALVRTMLYCGLVIGPVLAWLTLRCRSVWPAVILHYANNLAYYLR